MLPADGCLGGRHRQDTDGNLPGQEECHPYRLRGAGYGVEADEDIRLAAIQDGGEQYRGSLLVRNLRESVHPGGSNQGDIILNISQMEIDKIYQGDCIEVLKAFEDN